MQQTTVQLIFENWKNLNRLEFDEFMLNQEKTLLREEKEQIVDAWNNGAYGSSQFFHEFENAENYFNEYYINENNEQD
jgi:hypothetical protein